MNATSKLLTDKCLILYFDRLLPVDWDKEFGRKAPLMVEVGFGTGEYLLERARQNPDQNFVGLEINFELIKKTLKRIHAQKITNIRLVKVHALIALEYLFAPRSITRMEALFPFPWPKKRHHRHRLFKKNFFKLLNNRLTEQGQLMIVTDDKPFFAWVLAQARGTGFQTTKTEIPAQFQTRFERKWQAQGQDSFFQAMFIKKTHQRANVKKVQDIPPAFFSRFDPETYTPRSVTGAQSIIFKKFRFDERRQEGRQLVFAVEEPLVQGFTVLIQRDGKKWKAGLSGNEKILRTHLVKKGVRTAQKACRKN